MKESKRLLLFLALTVTGNLGIENNALANKKHKTYVTLISGIEGGKFTHENVSKEVKSKEVGQDEPDDYEEIYTNSEDSHDYTSNGYKDIYENSDDGQDYVNDEYADVYENSDDDLDNTNNDYIEVYENSDDVQD